MVRNRAYVDFKMAVRSGLTILSMFTMTNCKVSATKTRFLCVRMFLLYIHRISAFGDKRFERYGCLEPGTLSDLVKSNSCQCDTKQGLFDGKKW